MGPYSRQLSSICTGLARGRFCFGPPPASSAGIFFGLVAFCSPLSILKSERTTPELWRERCEGATPEFFEGLGEILVQSSLQKLLQFHDRVSDDPHLTLAN